MYCSFIHMTYLAYVCCCMHCVCACKSHPHYLSSLTICCLSKTLLSSGIITMQANFKAEGINCSLTLHSLDLLHRGRCLKRRGKLEQLVIVANDAVCFVQFVSLGSFTVRHLQLMLLIIIETNVVICSWVQHDPNCKRQRRLIVHSSSIHSLSVTFILTLKMADIKYTYLCCIL